MRVVVRTVFFLFVLTCVGGRKAKISISNGGYKDVVVGIADDVVPANQEDFIQSIRTLLEDASSNLYSATNNRIFFDTVTISVPSTWTIGSDGDSKSAIPFESSDIRVLNLGDEAHGDNPWTSHSGLCESQGEYIALTKNFIEGGAAFVESFGDKGKALVHEWAHFRWGVFEEYGFPGDSRFPYFYFPPGSTQQIATYSASGNLRGVYRTVDGTTCTPNDEGTYVPECRFYPNNDNSATISMMSYHFQQSATSFDDSSYHDLSVPSKHNQLCNYDSVWSVMMRNKVDFPGGNPVTFKEPSFNIVRRISEPVIFVIFDIGIKSSGTQQVAYADITEIKDHLKNVVPTLVGRHIGLGTYSSATSDILNIQFSIQKLASADQLNTIIDSIVQTQVTGSTFSFPIEKAIREISAYGAPAGGVVYVIGYTGLDSIGKYLEPHVISLALQNRVKIVGQESYAGRTGITSNLLRISKFTNGKLVTVPGNLTASEMDKNFEVLRDEFSSVTLTSRTVLSTLGQARASSSASFKFTLPPGSAGEVIVMVTGRKIGGGNIEACSLRLTTPAQTDVSGIVSANWEGGSSASNRLFEATSTASPGEWTAYISCTGPETTNPPFWIDVFESAALPKSFSVTSWTGSSGTNSIRLYAKVSEGSYGVTGATVIAHIRSDTAVPLNLNYNFNFTLIDNGFGDPDAAVDGIYSGLLIPPATLPVGNFKVGIEVKAKGTRRISWTGQGAIPSDQATICCGSSSGSVGAPLPTDFQEYFPDLVTLNIQQQLTNTYKPPKLTISSILVSPQKAGNYKVTLKWTAPPGSATDPTAPVQSYDVFYSDDIKNINVKVAAFDSCTPVSPGTEQTCTFSVMDFASQTIFARAAAKTGSQTGDLSTIAWSQPLFLSSTTESSSSVTTQATESSTTEMTTSAASTTTGSTTAATTTASETEATTGSTTTATSLATETTTATDSTTTGTTVTTGSTATGTTTGSTTTGTATATASTATGTTTAATGTTTTATGTTAAATETTTAAGTTTTATGTGTTTTTTSTETTTTVTGTTTAATGTTATGTTATATGTTSATETTATATGTTTTATGTTSKATGTTSTATGTTSAATGTSTATGTTTTATGTTTSATETTATATGTTTAATGTTTTATGTATTTAIATGIEETTAATEVGTETVSNPGTTQPTGTTSETTTGPSTDEPTKSPCPGGHPTCEAWFLPVVIAVPIGGVALIAAITALACYCSKKGKGSTGFDIVCFIASDPGRNRPRAI